MIKVGDKVKIVNPKPEDSHVAKHISHGLSKIGRVKRVSKDGSFWIDFPDGTHGIYHPDEVVVEK